MRREMSGCGGRRRVRAVSSGSASAAFAASRGTSWLSNSANNVSSCRPSRKRTPLIVASAGTSERTEPQSTTTGVTESG